MTIIPGDDKEAMAAALALLCRMMQIAEPTNDQRRFIGTLRKAQGLVSNNAIHLAKKESSR